MRFKLLSHTRIRAIRFIVLLQQCCWNEDTIITGKTWRQHRIEVHVDIKCSAMFEHDEIPDLAQHTKRKTKRKPEWLYFHAQENFFSPSLFCKNQPSCHRPILWLGWPTAQWALISRKLKPCKSGDILGVHGYQAVLCAPTHLLVRVWAERANLFYQFSLSMSLCSSLLDISYIYYFLHFNFVYFKITFLVIYV